MAIALALGAAMLFAVAAALHHDASTRAEPVSTPRSSLLLALISDRRWLIGTTADVVAVVLQTIALHLGELSVVQPVVALGLVLALPLSARLGHGRTSATSLWATGLIAVGIGLFAVTARPQAGSPGVSWHRWLLALVIVGGPALVAAALGSGRAAPRARAAWLALSAGLVVGLTAALTKASADVFARSGVVGLARTGLPVGLAVAALVGLELGQRSFQIAPLSASLPVLTASEPTVAVILGVVVFGEHLRLGRTEVALIAGAVALVAIGVAALARVEGPQPLDVAMDLPVPYCSSIGRQPTGPYGAPRDSGSAPSGVPAAGPGGDGCGPVRPGAAGEPCR